MFKGPADNEWKFTYLIVEISAPSPAQIILESYIPVSMPTSSLDEKRFPSSSLLDYSVYDKYGGGANSLNVGYKKGTGLGAEIIGTFVLVYIVFSATDPKRSARDSHVPVLAPLPIGFAVFMVRLATILVTGTPVNPAWSLGPAVIYNKDKPWDDH